MLTQERLKKLFDYNPETGWFTNKCDRGPAQKGARAGSDTGHGYRRITIGCERYYEHHLAWFYIYGIWPDELDHKDRVRSNNAIDNLREATRTQNCFNSKRETGGSGLRGAYWDSRVSKWYSKIQVGGLVKWLGYFSGPEEANKAYLIAIEKSAGEFALLPPTPILERRI